MHPDSLIEALRNPLRALRVGFRSPPSLSAERLVTRIHDLGAEPRLIIDVGANMGQFARAALEQWPEATVTSFEPHPDAFAELSRNLSDEKTRWRGFKLALSDHDGTETLFAPKYHLASSLRELSADNSFRLGSADVRHIDVPVSRLDTAVAFNSATPRPILLKIDVQGTELDVLTGATNLLPDIDYVLAELSFEENYEGEPLAEEVQAALAESGFKRSRPIDLFPRNGSPIQADYLFSREPTRSSSAE